MRSCAAYRAWGWKRTGALMVCHAKAKGWSLSTGKRTCENVRVAREHLPSGNLWRRIIGQGDVKSPPKIDPKGAHTAELDNDDVDQHEDVEDDIVSEPLPFKF